MRTRPSTVTGEDLAAGCLVYLLDGSIRTDAKESCVRRAETLQILRLQLPLFKSKELWGCNCRCDQSKEHNVPHGVTVVRK